MHRLSSLSASPANVFNTEQNFAMQVPIRNLEAQLIVSGNYCWASKLWEQLRLSLGSGDSEEAAVDKILSDKHLTEWIACQPEASFQNAIFHVSRQKLPILTLIHLASLAQTGRFTPPALFYLFKRALQSGVHPGKLIDKYPKLPFYLRSKSFDELEKATKERTNESDLKNFLSTAYYIAIENSELFDLAFALESKDGKALQDCLARAAPGYWLKFCSKAVQEELSLDRLEPEEMWKKLFLHLRSSAYFPSGESEKVGVLMNVLSTLSRDISYFDPRYQSGRQLRFLVENNSQQFPKCRASLEELQEKIDLCRKFFQPKKILAAFKNQMKDLHEIVKAKQHFAAHFDVDSFLSIFHKPIYQASAIYLFSVLTSSNKDLWPPELLAAWNDSQKNHHLSSYPAFSDYERMIYDVWNQFSTENPKCRQMDLPDLLKRRIATLDSNTLSELYHQMTRSQQVICRDALLSFFSDEGGKLRDIHWLLEGLL